MVIEIMFAYILDLIFGDPRWFPHPVKVQGWLIKRSEPFLRKIFSNERMAGIILVVLVVGLSWYISFIIIGFAVFINKYLGAFLSVIIIYSSLAVKDLGVESMDVYWSLKKQDTALARKKLSLIVGRDTHNLEYREMVRATVETVSENIVDGVISPLFYAFIGGAPLALAYKAVNTLDSMVGYKNKKYRYFGWASAKLDDLANYLPARLSMLFLPLAGLLAGKDALNSLKIAVRDGGKNPSPNSGISEAAVAGALGVRLGGVNYYNSQVVSKPLIGDDINALELNHIKETIKINYISSALFLFAGIFLIILIRR